MLKVNFPSQIKKYICIVSMKLLNYKFRRCTLLIHIWSSFVTLNYAGPPESKDHLHIALAQVNELHHFKVNAPQ
jgi:hypothetical protein